MSRPQGHLHRVAKVRGWTEQAPPKEPKTLRKPARRRRQQGNVFERIEHFLVFDTETTTDSTQQLNFGAASYYVVGTDGEPHMVQDFLIYADNLPERNPEGFATLQDYVLRGHRMRRGQYAPKEGATLADLLDRESRGETVPVPDKLPMMLYPPNEFSGGVNEWEIISNDVPREPTCDLTLVSQTEFVEFMYYVGEPRKMWSGNKPATVVGFNLPFDLSRIASGVVEARGQYTGGFSLRMPHESHNNIRLKPIGAKAHLMSFNGSKLSTPRGKTVDEESPGVCKAYFTDVATLLWSLTNNVYSLDGAAKAFNLTHQKREVEEHGKITLDYIGYCRDDVKATAELYMVLVKELAKHPVGLPDHRAYSPASLAKSYLPKMGIPKPLEKQPDFPNEVLGYCMASFYGGRAEAHIRRTPVPVLHVDVTSMYPTVDINMGLWDYLTHKRVDVREETHEVRELIDEATVETLLNRDTWKEIRGIALCLPDDDLLALRTKYGAMGAEQPGMETIGLSYVDSAEPMWWTIPDLINSKLHTGRTPHIIRALRFYPDGGYLDKLTPVTLRGTTTAIDPRTDDFFQKVIEQRQAIKANLPCGGCKNCERCRTEQFLKVLANAGSYGIFVEINRDASKLDEECKTIYGGLDEPWEWRVRKPEEPGAYCFPPIGTLITGAARLMLGILEKLVTDAGGTWAMCDTDSMAIVSSPDGTCGEQMVGDLSSDVPVLSYTTVENIRKRFDALNPYDPSLGISLIKREWPKALDDPQVYCYAISAKRYVLYTIDGEVNGLPVIRIVDNKEHGLGQYMSPIDPGKDELRGQRDWIGAIWEYLVQTHYAESLTIRPPQAPEWFDRPVMQKFSASTWDMYQRLRHWNHDREYPDQIKPHGFLMTPVVKPVGGLNTRNRNLTLITPFNSNRDEWTRLEFINLHNPDSPTRGITTAELPPDVASWSGSPIVQVKSYRDVVAQYAVHPEEKFSDRNGRPCRTETRGVLNRHHVTVAAYLHQGKESNGLEDRETGTVLDVDDIVTDYGSGQDDFQRFVLPALKELTSTQVIERVKELGLHVGRSQVQKVLSGSRKSGHELRQVLIRVAVELVVDALGDDAVEPQWKVADIAATQWREVLSTRQINRTDTSR